ncbi:MAG: hypothetical protein LBL04_05710 [Bacteroidales bacterium]|jgi:hypothetical protein|nr:hypothetical protein [Bacteroidales bacterium]
MNVLAIPEVTEYLERLVDILYEKEYFGFEDTSVSYIVELFEDIIKDLPNKRSKPAPEFFKKHGKELEYASFPKNKHTVWYVFFELYEDSGEITYLVKHIENNHTAAQYL